MILLIVLVCCPFYLQADSVPIGLDIQRVIELTDQQNPQRLIAQASYQAMLARLSLARAAIMPQLELQGNFMRQQRDIRTGGVAFAGVGPRIGPYNVMEAKLVAGINLLDPESLARLKAASQERHAATIDQERLRQDILAMNAQLYLNAKRAWQKVNTAIKLYQWSLLAFEQAKVQFAQGLANQNHFLSQQAALLHAKQLLYQTRQDQELTKLDLLAALGLDQDQEIVFELDQWSYAYDQEIHSADLRLAQANITVAKAQLHEGYAGLLPKLSLVGDLGRAGNSWDASSSVYSAGIKVSFPLFEGGAQQAQIGEDQANLKKSKMIYTDTERQLLIRIAKARYKANTMRQALELARQQLEIAKMVYQQCHEQLRLGADSPLNVSKALMDVSYAYDDVFEAKAHLLMALVDLAHSQGQVHQLASQRRQ